MSLGLTAVTVGGIVYGYLMASERAEWSAYSLAAQSLAMQRMEQCRAAKWDPMGVPAVDRLVATNFPVQVETLDVPITGTNTVLATNYATIIFIATNPPLKMIRIDCVWPFRERGLFTNTVATYRAPDE